MAGIVGEEILEQLGRCLAYSWEVKKHSLVRKVSSAGYGAEWIVQRRFDSPAAVLELRVVFLVCTYLVLTTLARRGTRRCGMICGAEVEKSGTE